MKKCFFILFIIAFSNISNAQIEVRTFEEVKKIGQVKTIDGIIAEITYNIKEPDTIYTLAFKNGNYDIVSVSFNGQDSTLFKFYKIMKSVFLPENKKNKNYTVFLKLGESEVSIARAKPFQGTSACFSATGGSLYLLEPQVDKLFGK